MAEPRTVPAPGLETRFQRILVPIYFDDTSSAAVQYARNFAEESDGTVHLLHVVPTDEFHLLGTVYDPLGGGGANIDWAERVAKKELEAIGRRHLGRIRWQPMTVVGSNPVARILESAEATDADLLILGTHGRTGLAHLVFGSIAERVVRECRRPVFVTRQTGVTEPAPFRHILCPIDLDDRFSNALEIARDIALGSGGKVHVLHVVPTGEGSLSRSVYAQPTGGPRNLIVAEQAATDRAREMAARTLSGVEHYTEIHTSSDPARTILEVERALGADLLVMTTHGFGGIVHLIVGSVTERMIREADCPVLSVLGA